METSNSIATIAGALSKAQGQITAAKMDGFNPHFKSHYATLAAVWDACRKPLTDNGLAVVQRTFDVDGYVMLETMLAHESGEWLTSVLPVCAVGDKPQSMGSALSYARRYGLSAMVGIVADEDDDANSAQNGQQPRQRKQQRNGQSQDEFDSLPSHPNSTAKPLTNYDPEPDKWRSPDDAKAWGYAQTDAKGKPLFTGKKHLENAYNKVRADEDPQTASQMWAAWIAYVEDKRAIANSNGKDEPPTQAELDAIAAADS